MTLGMFNETSAQEIRNANQRQRGRLPETSTWALPPFPGEMGIEIRYFLGRVEPWLRVGWVILARRPAFYPPGTTVVDEAYFAAESDLFARYGARRLAFGPKLEVAHPRWLPLLSKRRTLKSQANLMKEWRSLFALSYERPARPTTRWDRDLLTPSSQYLRHVPFKHGDVVPPSYLPTPFTSKETRDRYARHVGVQLRLVRASKDPRNSDSRAILRDAEALSGDLGLPILVYGDPSGCVLPDHYPNTWALGEGRLLERELGYLRSCAIMLAPHSGWADLMCWLRVPCIVEDTMSFELFRMMAPFRPRLCARVPGESVTRQARWLLSGGTALVMAPGAGQERGLC